MTMTDNLRAGRGYPGTRALRDAIAHAVLAQQAAAAGQPFPATRFGRPVDTGSDSGIGGVGGVGGVPGGVDVGGIDTGGVPGGGPSPFGGEGPNTGGVPGGVPGGGVPGGVPGGPAEPGGPQPGDAVLGGP